LFVEEPVVRLMSGLGRAAYLGPDGRAWVGDLGGGEVPRVLGDPKSARISQDRRSGGEQLIERLARLILRP
jgi:hypothetical protein